MSNDSEELRSQAPSDEQLKSISELAVEQSRLESEVEEAEVALKEKNELLRLVSEVRLPAAMEAVNMDSFRLKDGRSITIKEHVAAAITKEHEPAAFAWLEKTGNEGIIKNEFSIPFGKGQNDEAEELERVLEERGVSYSKHRGVHHSTLKAFVKKQLESGSPIPVDLFSIFVKKVATIK